MGQSPRLHGVAIRPTPTKGDSSTCMQRARGASATTAPPGNALTQCSPLGHVHGRDCPELYSAAADRTVRVWDTDQRGCAAHVPGHPLPTREHSLTP